jgi:hypothetical protein
MKFKLLQENPDPKLLFQTLLILEKGPIRIPKWD